MYNISRYYYMADRNVNDKICFTNDLHEKTLFDFVGFNLLDGCSPNEKINSLEYKKYFSIPGAQLIRLSTTYPGLLIGSGYSHPALTGEDEEKDSDYQLGFFFDHTTGMPVIPGSSVKGKLKSVFPKNMSDVYYESKLDYIKCILEEKSISIPNLENDWKEIFFERKQVFFDAYITKAPLNLFEDDYITPHPRLFGNPTPLKFLKIAPSVQFTFQFHLKDYPLEKAILSAVQIKEVFERIILDFGIGAKTNVGYGYFK